MADNTTTYNTVVDVQVKGEGSLDNLNQTVDDTGQGFVRLQRQIKETNIELQRAAASGDKVKFNELKKQLDDLEEGLEKVQFKSKQFDDQLSALPGPAGQAGQAIKSIDGAFKLLAANPIIAIIGAAIGIFLLLKKSLESTAEGQAVLNRISTAFSKILGPIMALIESVAVPLFEKLAGILEAVGGAFAFVAEKLGISKKKIDEASSGVKDFAAENKKAAEEAKKQAKEDSERRKKEAEDRKKKAEERKKQLAEEKQKAIDNAKLAIDLAEALKESEDKLSQARTKIYGDKIAQMEQEQNFADKNYQREKKRIDDLMKINNLSEDERKKLLIERTNLEAQYETDTRNRQFTLSEEKKQIAKKDAEDNRAILLSDLQSEFEILDEKNKLSDIDFEQDLQRYAEQRDILNQQQALELQNEDLTEFQKTEIRKKYADARKNISDAEVATEKAAIEAKHALNMQYIDLFSQFGNLLQQAAGKNKTLAIAGLLIEQGSAVAKIITQMRTVPAILPPGIPNPAFIPSRIQGGLSIAAAIAATAKGIQQINSAASKAGIGGGGGGSVSMGGGSGGSAPSAPSLPTMNAPMVNVGGGANPTQQIADTLAASTQKPIKAYVVSGDVSSQQALDRRTSRAATFSGG